MVRHRQRGKALLGAQDWLAGQSWCFHWEEIQLQWPKLWSLYQGQVCHCSLLHLQQSNQCWLWERFPQHQLGKDLLHLCHVDRLWVCYRLLQPLLECVCLDTLTHAEQSRVCHWTHVVSVFQPSCMPVSLETSPPSSRDCTRVRHATMLKCYGSKSSSAFTRFPTRWGRGWRSTSNTPGPTPMALIWTR